MIASTRRTIVRDRLDWSPNHDDRSRLYGVAGVLDPAHRLAPESVGWRLFGSRLIQGPEGECVPIAGAHVRNSAPHTTHPDVPLVTLADVHPWYALAQRLDRVPGEAYVGTSVLAGLKAGQQLGYWPEYRWCFDVDQLAAGVAQLGPAVVGVPWYSGMYRQDPDRPVARAGVKRGGHSLAVLGYVEHNRKYGTPGFVWLNGHRDYGQDGRAFVPRDVMAELLAEQGEAGIPLRKLDAAP